MKLVEEWNQETKSVIEDLLNSEIQNPVAVFDFDNTLIYGDQGTNLMNYLILNLLIKGNEDWFWDESHWQYVDKKDYENVKLKFNLAYLNKDDVSYAIDLLDEIYKVFYKLEEINLEIAYRWTKILFAGFTIQELKQYSEISFRNALNDKIEDFMLPSGNTIQQGIRIHPLFYRFVQELKKREWKIFIITASPEPAIQAISYYWSIPEEYVIGMKLKQSHGILLPEIIEPYTYNEGKYLNLKKHIDEPITIAVGDSLPDIFMLEKAKVPIFVKRKNKESLLKIAKEKNFYIQNVEYE
ncbi:MAG: haloacid dehalogenase-like hydrolase [Leptospiraceae bacterium]|jgi:phosphoserine phosphatase|nr:haloacid dehalogenase-like hydrolase [Leptospiraceae bacterium]